MQQFSLSTLSLSRAACICLAAIGLILNGCGREEIRTVSVPKEVSNSQPIQTPAVAAAAPVQWTTPAGWKEQPPGGMRAGSFTIGEGSDRAEVSIIPLGGVSGSELDNVNRWRGQVGLPPVDAPALEASGEKVMIGAAPSSLYDLAGTDPQSKQATRILASILSSEGTTWFFKMIGTDTLVAREKSAFTEFLKSIRIQSGAAPVAASVESTHPVSTNPNDMVAAHGAVGQKPTWEIPPGWEEQAPSSMRLATFSITGEGGAKADLSVTKLAGTAGGMLANLNRWRSQVGLEPVDQAELDKLITVRDAGGAKLSFVDMAGKSLETGNPARMLVAIVPRTGTTWFYKLLGTDNLVAQQKPAFIKFVETARYPNAS